MGIPPFSRFSGRRIVKMDHFYSGAHPAPHMTHHYIEGGGTCREKRREAYRWATVGLMMTASYTARLKVRRSYGPNITFRELLSEQSKYVCHSAHNGLHPHFEYDASPKLALIASKAASGTARTLKAEYPPLPYQCSESSTGCMVLNPVEMISIYF